VAEARKGGITREALQKIEAAASLL